MKARPHTPQVRRSACADAALRAEIERVAKMTVEERVKTALSLGRRFADMKTAARGK
ncbi:MAG: hypothetical protein ACO3JG_11440 [Luteolibacter sp.]